MIFNQLSFQTITNFKITMLVVVINEISVSVKLNNKYSWSSVVFGPKMHMIFSVLSTTVEQKNVFLTQAHDNFKKPLETNAL